MTRLDRFRRRSVHLQPEALPIRRIVRTESAPQGRRVGHVEQRVVVVIIIEEVEQLTRDETGLMRRHRTQRAIRTGRLGPVREQTRLEVLHRQRERARTERLAILVEPDDRVSVRKVDERRRDLGEISEGAAVERQQRRLRVLVVVVVVRCSMLQAVFEEAGVRERVRGAVRSGRE